jgi:hypothetical protein
MHRRRRQQISHLKSRRHAKKIAKIKEKIAMINEKNRKDKGNKIAKTKNKKSRRQRTKNRNGRTFFSLETNGGLCMQNQFDFVAFIEPSFGGIANEKQTRMKISILSTKLYSIEHSR